MKKIGLMGCGMVARYGHLPAIQHELIGTRGVIRYDVGQQLFKMENETGEHRFEFHGEKDFTGMYAEWARALHSGKSDLLTSVAAGMRVVEIAREATHQVIRDRPAQR